VWRALLVFSGTSIQRRRAAPKRATTPHRLKYTNQPLSFSSLFCQWLAAVLVWYTMTMLLYDTVAPRIEGARANQSICYLEQGLRCAQLLPHCTYVVCWLGWRW
jgi:hypothetical protein